MTEISQKDRLIERLEFQGGSSTARDIADRLSEHGSISHILELLSELTDISGRIGNEAASTFPEVYRRCGVSTMGCWLDLAVSLAHFSGATALKYLRESPILLGVLETDDLRQSVLSVSLELAEESSEYAPNCAFEFFRKAPELLLVIPSAELASWGEIGLELAEWNFVLGIEFLKESPNIAAVLPRSEVRAWIAFGMKLVTQNSFGKQDYLGTLEFFRKSPFLLGEIQEARLRADVVNVGSCLADQSPDHALTFLANAPQWIASLPEGEWRHKVLQYGALLAEKDSNTALAYFQRSPEIFGLVHTSSGIQEVFETWFKGGMEILGYSPEGACAYFSLETGKALGSILQAMNGVPLRHVARSLKLFARMLCNEDMAIESLPGTVGQDGPTVASSPGNGESASPAVGLHAKLSSDRKTLFLPALLNRHARREDNYRHYLVLTAHEVGHVECGTYQVDLKRLQDLVHSVAIRYALTGRPSPALPLSSLDDLFQRYPQKGVIQDLWTIIEDARVEYYLQQEYPGFRRDLEVLAREAVTTRSFLHGMTAREMVIDSLLLLFAAGEEQVAIQKELQPVVDRVWEMARTILRTDATAEEAVRLADRVYQVLDDMIATLRLPDSPAEQDRGQEEQSDLGAGPRAAEELSDQYRPITNWAYRGQLDPQLVQGPMETPQSRQKSHGEGPSTDKNSTLAARSSSGTSEQELSDGKQWDRENSPEGRKPSSALEQWLTVKTVEPNAHADEETNSREFFYDEWDGRMQDYRSHWCRVIERPGEEGSQDFAHATLEKHGPMVRLLRRYFEVIRPTAQRKLYGQEDGEEIDLDATIGYVADRVAGVDPSDRVYIRRDKRERQVAAAFLIDLSGSTGRQIDSGYRRVIDVEKEGLILLSEALEAIGDQYALYGFSGQGRHHVEFVVIKDFEEQVRYRMEQRIDALAPLHQNRDGAAIRHASHKILQCAARHRLLIMLSDGRPLDKGYSEEYALEDTKMALREARQAGIVPFCLTIDRESRDDLKRMYGDVRYVILDDIAKLPDRLPRLYHQLTTS